MIIDITMLTLNRLKLVEQALNTLFQRTEPEAYRLTVWDDGSVEDVRQRLVTFAGENVYHHHADPPTGGAAPARNAAIALHEKMWKRHDLLYLSDNDVAFQPYWLEVMLEAWEVASADGFAILGGYCHPYNATPIHTIPVYSTHLKRTIEVREVVALATQSWLLDWSTYDRYGPFPEAEGINRSEDVHFCNLVRGDGKKVGYVHPFVVLPSGLTDTYGNKAIGAELLTPHEGVLML